MVKKILITDTSVLINFLNINKIDLLVQYAGKFYITDHVFDEITTDYSHQAILLAACIEDDAIEVVRVDEEAELAIFSRLYAEHRLGLGECSAIACAINRKFCLAIDDKAARKKAAKECKDISMINTQEIMVELLHAKIISVSEADKIKLKWEQEYKFMLKIESFKDLVELKDVIIQ